MDARKPDNSSGLPANNTLQISSLLVDGAAYLGGIPYSLTSAATFPAIVPLTGDGIAPPAQDGLAFRRLQLALFFSKSATTDDSARLVDLGLYYDLWRPQRYAYQFAIDFTDAAWGYPRSSMGRLDRGAAISTLLGLQDTKARFQVTFGGSGDRQVVVPAAEILIASRADDNQRGIFPVTIRDVSAPASG